MIWGSFAGSRVGDLHKVTGTLNQKGYHSILQHHAIPSLYAELVRGSSFSKIMTQNIPPGYVRSISEEKNKMVGFKSWNGQHSLQT